MSVRDRFISLCEEELAYLRRQLDMFESGRMRTIEPRDSAGWQMVDTTAESIQEVKRKIAKFDSILSEFSQEQ